MLETALTYLQRGQSGIFAEVYFPRRIAAQGIIFDALEAGYNQTEVKRYLKGNADVLLQELQGYQYIFDPLWFEEATQVIRLMFRLDSRYVKEATAAQCQDVLRAMLFWMITRQGRLDDIAPWDKAEQERFIKEYEPMSKHKKEFAQDYFERVARETFKWMGDCFLFIFGYLVRQFSEHLTKRGKPEKEIWAATFFNLTVSVVKKAEQQTLVTKGELQ